jgi:hypothetical protein
MRQTRSLAGFWQFQLDPEGLLEAATLAPDRQIQVPMPWQAAFPELQQYSGYAWYRHYFELEETWLGGELLLHFGAVDYWCQIFINGQLAGQHEGGYTPFTLPIRSHVQPSRNEIALRVYDPVQTHMLVPRWPDYSATTGSHQPPFDANHIPHGKQEWYINVGGIWQDVTLSAVSPTYLSRVAVTTDIQTGEAHFKLELAGEGQASGELLISVQGKTSQTWDTSLSLAPGQTAYQATIRVEAPQLWNVDTPNLYIATVRLKTANDKEDSLVTRFGFREIITKNGQLMLNGEPLFLLSALDQDLYADTIYTVPSEEYLRDQFTKAKQLGLNNLRCHIKPPDPLYLDLADEMGLLVWAEIPSWRTFYPKGTVHPNQLNLDDTIKQRVEQTLQEMIRRDFNHPSLIIWTIVNEDWGTALPLSASDRTWVSQMYERCKQLDPTRLVVDNSACPNAWGPNVHVRSDLDDFHIYANIPDQAAKFEQTLEQFNLRPLWTYSSQGDSQRSGQEPLILSEFGNWGLPSVETLRRHYKGDPDWFKIGPWWSPWDGEPGWAGGVLERFEELGLDPIWGDYEKFATATQWHQFAALKFEIETMRRQPRLAGYVITELSDIYWESNGLLDFLRNPKVYHDQFHTINAPDMIIPHLERYAYWDDQPLRVQMVVSHYSSQSWHQARLGGVVGNAAAESEELPHPIERGEVKSLGLRHWKLPKLAKPQEITCQFTISTPDEAELARNQLKLFVLPASERNAKYQGEVAVITRNTGLTQAGSDLAMLTPENEGSGESGRPGVEQMPVVPQHQSARASSLSHALEELGYNVNTHLTLDTRLAISNYPNEELLRWVREGGDLLFISNGPSPFYWVQGRGGAYSGNWMSSFSWLRPGIYRRLENVSNPLEMPFKRIMPTGTILGLPVNQPEMHADFLAGQVGGWVNLPAVHTVQFRYGQGRVIMTTFELIKSLQEFHDPVAVAMLHDLVEYLASDQCQPRLTANF